MNRLRARTGYKAAVVVVLIISIIAGLLSVAGFAWMVNEGYYDFEESVVPDEFSIRLKDVPFEETWTPQFEISCARDNLCAYLDIELLSDDTEIDEELLLSRIDLEDGRTLLVSMAPELLENNGYRFSNVSISLSDPSGKVIYENTPAVRDSAYQAYIPIGIGIKGDVRYQCSSVDNGFYADFFKYYYLTYEELTEYAIENCETLFEPVSSFIGTYYAPHYVSYSDVSGSDTVQLYSEEIYDADDMYGNAAYIIMEKDGEDYSIPAETVLADYAWVILRSGYYNYGYDESKGCYYVTEHFEEFIEPIAVLGCSASLLGDESLDDNMDFYRGLYEVLYPHRVTVIVVGLLSVIACIVAFILMLCYAGWRRDSDTPQLRWIDKIPLEIFCFGVFILGILLLQAFDAMAYAGNDIAAWLGAVVCGIAAIVIGICFCMSIARRIKTRTFFKNTVCAYAFRLAKKIIAALPSIWVVVLGGMIYGFVSLLCIVSMEEAVVLLWAFISLALFAAVCLFDFQLSSIIKTAEKISRGDAESKVDTGKLLPHLKKHGESINRIGDSVKNAVDERLKSERMKTDLIANVSHDIKTPLTSVINYIDLLKHTDISDPAALEYIAVLERQSVRLKRLAQDIVDASKASSGCINANLEPVDLRELLSQSTAEYADRLAASSITPVVNVDEDCSGVMADGRLLWRVFDNLLSNICKYSQPGTRAYIKAARFGDSVEISFRNISAEELNIPVETLMERFVRGDRSRHTEGSGLGLSIAQSLAELQNGRLKMSIDGDLFRVSVMLPACELPVRAEESVQEADSSASAPAEFPVLSVFPELDEQTAPRSTEYQPQPGDGWLELPTLAEGSEE